jgi:TRAP-type mannitol/chloroaromatic compound transport system permease small subunit
MKTLLALARAIDGLNEGVGRAVAWLVLAASLVSAGNAAARYLLHASSNAWLEIQWYMFAAMFLLAAGYALRHDEHVRVDIFYHRLSARGQAWVDLLGGVLFLLPTALLIGWLSWPMFLQSWTIAEVSPDPGGLVRWPVRLLVPLGFVLLALQGAAEVIKRVGVLTGHHRLEPRSTRLRA